MNCCEMNVPSIIMPVSCDLSDCAASSHVRPLAPSWWYGSNVAYWANTFFTSSDVQSSLPPIRLMWKS